MDTGQEGFCALHVQAGFLIRAGAIVAVSRRVGRELPRRVKDYLAGMEGARCLNSSHSVAGCTSQRQFFLKGGGWR